MSSSSHRELDLHHGAVADGEAQSAAAAPGADAGELPSVFAELTARSASFLDLDGGQRRAWVSGMLSAWRSDIVVEDPDAADRAFVTFLRQEGPAIVDKPVADAIETTAMALLDPQPDPDVSITRSWLVTDHRSPDELTVVITVHRADAEYSILGSVVAGLLADLQVSGDVVDLLGANPDEITSSRPSLEVSVTDADQAKRVLVDGWTARGQDSGAAELTESLVTNQMMGRADLVALGASSESLPLFQSGETTSVPFFPGCSDTEIADGNRWAVEALTTALRPYRAALDADAECDPSWQQPIPQAEIAVPFQGPLNALSRREQDAIVYLEWADWVGAIVGIIATPQLTGLDGDTVVGLINAQPELTSAIEPSDHDYVAYGFDVALAVWADAGLISEGQIVPGGRAGLVAAALMAWRTGCEPG